MSDMKVMATDPRILKELLLSQWLAGADPLGFDTDPVSSVRDGDDSLFSQLLAQMLESESLAASAGFGSSGAYGGSGTSDSSQLFGPSGPLGLSGLNAWTGGSAGLIEDVGATSLYDPLIKEAAARYGVDPALVKAIIQTESSFRADAVSSSGAKGLMQLMDGTARGLGVTDAFDPAQNIDGGTRYISYLLRKYDGNEMAALAAYNAGPGRVDRLGLRTNEDVLSRLSELPAETQAYIRKVLDARSNWTSLL